MCQKIVDIVKKLGYTNNYNIRLIVDSYEYTLKKRLQRGKRYEFVKRRA